MEGRSTWDKSIIAVFFGLLGGLLWSALAAFTIAIVASIAAGATGAHESVAFVVTAIVTMMVGAFAAGWIAAKRAPSSPLAHALVCGVGAGVLSMGWDMPTAIRQLQFIGALVICLLGGWAKTIQKERRRHVAMKVTP